MSDHHDEHIEHVTVRRGPWLLVRFSWALTALFVSAALLLSLIYLAPVVGHLADQTADEKARDACEALHTNAITEASFGVSSNLGVLLVGIIDVITTPPDQRDLGSLQSPSADIKVYTEQYRAAIESRKSYVSSGRPLPCDLAD